MIREQCGEVSIEDVVLDFKVRLASSPAFATLALLALFDRQTAGERATRMTMERNGVGFTASDAPVLSSLARRVLCGFILSERQLAVAHKRLPKYAGQLARLAQSRSWAVGVAAAPTAKEQEA
jgi:hypothetical protein